MVFLELIPKLTLLWSQNILCVISIILEVGWTSSWVLEVAPCWWMSPVLLQICMFDSGWRRSPGPSVGSLLPIMFSSPESSLTDCCGISHGERSVAVASHHWECIPSGLCVLQLWNAIQPHLGLLHVPYKPIPWSLCKVPGYSACSDSDMVLAFI